MIGERVSLTEFCNYGHVGVICRLVYTENNQTFAIAGPEIVPDMGQLNKTFDDIRDTF